MVFCLRTETLCRCCATFFEKSGLLECLYALYLSSPGALLLFALSKPRWRSNFCWVLAHSFDGSSKRYRSTPESSSPFWALPISQLSVRIFLSRMKRASHQLSAVLTNKVCMLSFLLPELYWLPGVRTVREVLIGFGACVSLL